MSYCRNNGKNSDVYVIASGREGCTVWICYCGGLEDDPFETNERRKMVDHLLEHRAKGDKVPQSALDRLKKEIMSFLRV